MILQRAALAPDLTLPTLSFRARQSNSRELFCAVEESAFLENNVEVATSDQKDCRQAAGHDLSGIISTFLEHPGLTASRPPHMAAENKIDHDAARATLKKAWSDLGSTDEPSPKMKQYIEEVLEASDVTYKYILVTGFLAKYVNPKIHARALQKGSDLRGAYDARSLAHKVVVGFEKSKGNLFGLSNEPFVNKPARHPEHDKNNDQLRNKAIAESLHEALEQAQGKGREEVYKGLVHILRIGARSAKNEKKVNVTKSCNLECITDFIEEFLQHTDGGARLVAVWGALTTLLAEKASVKAYSPNVADRFAKTAGDVEVKYDKHLVSATECKQRPINLDDVKHGIKKAIENGVPEYLFVISKGVVKGDEEQIQQALKHASKAIDTTVIDIHEQAHFYALMLNPARRAKFGLEVVRLLREMRKFESANEAAKLWNLIMTGKGLA